MLHVFTSGDHASNTLHLRHWHSFPVINEREVQHSTYTSSVKKQKQKNSAMKKHAGRNSLKYRVDTTSADEQKRCVRHSHQHSNEKLSLKAMTQPKAGLVRGAE